MQLHTIYTNLWVTLDDDDDFNAPVCIRCANLGCTITELYVLCVAFSRCRFFHTINHIHEQIHTRIHSPPFIEIIPLKFTWSRRCRFYIILFKRKLHSLWNALQFGLKRTETTRFVVKQTHVFCVPNWLT